MTVNIRRRSGACLVVVLVLSACAGGAPSVEPPPLGEPPQGSAVSPTSVTAGGGNDSSVTVSSSSTVVGEVPWSAPSVPVGAATSVVVPPTEFGGDLGGVFVDVSAGLGYSCGLREGGGVECWDLDWRGSLPKQWWERVVGAWSFDFVDSVPPGGVFTEVSVGWRNACGLRLSGRLECWGANRTAVVYPPSGVFSGVSVGLEHACGVRPGGRLECWGDSGRRRPAGLPPDGVFLDFALGRSFGCGIRADYSLECWGPYYTHEVRGSGVPRVGVMPEGKFASLHAEGFYICGLRLEGSVECWGSGRDPAQSRVRYLLPPSGEFASILGVNEYEGAACGRRPTGEVECWREGRDGEPDSWVVPAEHEAVPPREGGVCGAGFTGRRICFESGGETGSPAEVKGIVSYAAFQYSFDVDDIYVYYNFEYLCGLRPGGEVVCGYFGYVCEGLPEASGGDCRLFGDQDYPEFLEHLWRDSPSMRDTPPFPPAPAGVFTVLKAGLGFFCGLRPGGEAACWGREGSRFGLLSPPSGVFTKIDTSDHFACGLRPQGELECWGSSENQSKILPPKEEFTDVHAGWSGLEVRSQTGTFSSSRDWGFSCGLLTGDGVDCWGEDRLSGVAPEGGFTQIGAGKEEFCGLRPSGVIECWGSGPESTPEGELHDAGGEGYKALSVGGESTCGLTRGGSVNCWTHDGRLVYQKEGPYTSISAGFAHQCGVLATGDIHCWETRSTNPANWQEITYPAARGDLARRRPRRRFKVADAKRSEVNTLSLRRCLLSSSSLLRERTWYERRNTNNSLSRSRVLLDLGDGAKYWTLGEPSAVMTYTGSS